MRTTIFTLASVTVCFGIVGACTQDFDTFSGAPPEGGTTGSSNGGSNGSSGGGSTSGGTSGTTTSSGGSTSGGTSTSGSTSGSPPVDCQMVSGSCFQQGQTCNDKCNADHTTCSGVCPNGNQGKACRTDCDTKQTACLAACKMTCEQCAGPACRNLCP
jgi:hypothetical protein